VSLKGITLTVKADDDLQGELRLEFGAPPNAMASFGLALTVEALEGAGLALDDLEKWNQSVDGNAMVMRGKFTEKGLRALLVPLTPTVLSSQASLADKVGSADPKAQIAKRYFDSVTNMLDELQEGKNNKSLNRIWYLYKEYSRKIDEIPILDVDPELLQWGASISSTVREMANQAHLNGRTNTALSANIVEGVASVPNARQYYGGGYGWGYQYSAPGLEWQSNRQQMNNLMAMGNLSESARRQETWKNINAATFKMRQAMVAKYKIEF
jgi:hypothetical protein